VRIALTVIKLLGLFHIARSITRDGLRIICYPGSAVAEEHKFRSRLFIRKELFLRRIAHLRRKRFPILPLSAALEALDRDRLPSCATVITMDDAWQGVYSVALPVIRELRIPVTLYVPTYYIEHRMPVFTVTLSYLFWLTKARSVTLPAGLGTFRLETEAEAEEAEALAQELGVAAGDRVKVASNRGHIKAVAVVTKRLRALKVDGKILHTVGIPIHWGFTGLAKPGFLANTLTPVVGDGNSQTPEFKSFLVKVEKI